MASLIDSLLADAVADGHRVSRVVFCDECPSPAAGRCNGCGKCLCQGCLEAHRRPGPKSECSGRPSEPRSEPCFQSD